MPLYLTKQFNVLMILSMLVHTLLFVQENISLVVLWKEVEVGSLSSSYRSRARCSELSSRRARSQRLRTHLHITVSLILCLHVSPN